jgi:hypothetical protein
MTRKELILAAFKLNGNVVRDVAKHEDSDGYFGFISGAEWEDARLRPLIEELAGCVALFERAQGLCVCQTTSSSVVKAHPQLQCNRCAQLARLDALLERIK